MNRAGLLTALLVSLLISVSFSGAAALGSGEGIKDALAFKCEASNSSVIKVPKNGVAFQDGEKVERVECNNIEEYRFTSKTAYERTQEKEMTRISLAVMSSLFLVMSLAITAYGGRRKGNYRDFVKSLVTAYSPSLLLMSLAAVSIFIYTLSGLSAFFSLVMMFTIILFLGMVVLPLFITVYLGLKRKEDRGIHIAISILALITQFFIAILLALELSSPMLCCA